MCERETERKKNTLYRDWTRSDFSSKTSAGSVFTGGIISACVCVCASVCVCVCVCVSALALASKLTHTHETHLHPSTHTRLINFCVTIIPARHADGHSKSHRDRHRHRLTYRHTETLVERTRKHFGPILLNPALSAPLPSALPPSISIAFSVSASEHHQVGEEST